MLVRKHWKIVHLKTLMFLNEISEYLNCQIWEIKKRKKTSKSQVLELDINDILSKFRTNNRDDDNSPIKELGFNLGIWNGNSNTPLSINIACGGFSKYVRNSVVLKFPPCDNADVIMNLDYYKQILNVFVKVWEPDNLLLTSNEYMSRNKVDVYNDKGGGVVYKRGESISFI